MANVLTTEEKKNLDRRQRARYVSMFALVAFASALVAMLALVPPLVAITTARAALSATLAGTLTQEERDAADRARFLVEALLPLVDAPSPTALLAVALAQQPEDVSITAITFSVADGRIVLSGQADRQAVNDFRAAMQATGRFGGVDVPVAALVGAQNSRFTMTLTDFK